MFKTWATPDAGYLACQEYSGQLDAGSSDAPARDAADQDTINSLEGVELMDDTESAAAPARGGQKLAAAIGLMLLVGAVLA